MKKNLFLILTLLLGILSSCDKKGKDIPAPPSPVDELPTHFEFPKSHFQLKKGEKLKVPVPKEFKIAEIDGFGDDFFSLNDTKDIILIDGKKVGHYKLKMTGVNGLTAHLKIDVEANPIKLDLARTSIHRRKTKTIEIIEGVPPFVLEFDENYINLTVDGNTISIKGIKETERESRAWIVDSDGAKTSFTVEVIDKISSFVKEYSRNPCVEYPLGEFKDFKYHNFTSVYDRPGKGSYAQPHHMHLYKAGYRDKSGNYRYLAWSGGISIGEKSSPVMVFGDGKGHIPVEWLEVLDYGRVKKTNSKTGVSETYGLIWLAAGKEDGTELRMLVKIDAADLEEIN